MRRIISLYVVTVFGFFCWPGIVEYFRYFLDWPEWALGTLSSSLAVLIYAGLVGRRLFYTREMRFFVVFIGFFFSVIILYLNLRSEISHMNVGFKLLLIASSFVPFVLGYFDE